MTDQAAVPRGRLARYADAALLHDLTGHYGRRLVSPLMFSVELALWNLARCLDGTSMCAGSWPTAQRAEGRQLDEPAARQPRAECDRAGLAVTAESLSRVAAVHRHPHELHRPLRCLEPLFRAGGTHPIAAASRLDQEGQAILRLASQGGCACSSTAMRRRPLGSPPYTNSGGCRGMPGWTPDRKRLTPSRAKWSCRSPDPWQSSHRITRWEHRR